jgi:hypothetical protein
VEDSPAVTFEDIFFYPFDELCLGKSSRQRGDNVNMISNTANAHNFGTEVAATVAR